IRGAGIWNRTWIFCSVNWAITWIAGPVFVPLFLFGSATKSIYLKARCQVGSSTSVLVPKDLGTIHFLSLRGTTEHLPKWSWPRRRRLATEPSQFGKWLIFYLPL